MITKLDVENSGSLDGKPNVLYIDDDVDNLSSFKYQFMDFYNITLAENADEGYSKLKEKEYPIIIADQRMPGTTGTQFFEKILPEYPKSKRMILTGFSDFQSIIDAINKGKIYYYLQKPWNEQEVRLVIRNALEAVEYENKNDELIKILKDANERLEKSREELRLRIEESLAAERRYRDLFENNPISIWEEDFSDVKKYLDTIRNKDILDYYSYLTEHPEIIEKCINLIKVIDVNQATLRTHKVKEKNELVNNLLILFKPKSFEVFKKEFVAILNGEFKLEEESSIVSLTGETLYVTIHWSVSPGFESDYSRVLVSLVDITERKLAEKSLRESEEKFRTTFENASIGMSLTDLEGKYLLVNESYASMIGYKKEEIIGKSLADFTYQEDIDLSFDKIKKVLSGEISVLRFAKRFINKNGNLIWADINTVLIRDYENKPLYFVTHIVDITETKKIMEELIVAKEKAEKSDRLKSEFLSQMSHEIRSPLNVTLSYASYIKAELERYLSEDMKRCFAGIDMAGRRLIRTVDLILNTSEMQVGTYLPIWTDINLVEDVLKELQKEYSIIANEKKLELDLINNTENSMISCDRYSIQQAFANLIDNAIKFTSEGKIEIIINRDSKNSLCVSIVDTGVGMSEEFMKNLFIPFVQESQGYSRRFEGNGLGLALVKKYLDLNNARITVESEQGVGSKFTVTIFEKRELANSKGL